jgi:Flp pilus assembly pilin Flp
VLKFCRRVKRRTKGSGLVEYGILGGLISIVSIGAVLSVGKETQDVFSGTQTKMAENLSRSLVGDGPGEEAPVEDSTTYISSAAWDTNAAEDYRSFAAGSAWVRGHAGSYYSPGWGSRTDLSGPLTVWAFFTMDYDDAGVTDETVLHLRDDQTANINPSMFVRCDGQADIPISTARLITYISSYPQRTVVAWDGMQLSLAAGEVYSCAILEPEAL